MTALFARVAAPVWRWLALAAAVAAAFLFARQTGKDAVRAAARAETLEQVETRNAVDRVVARDPDPAGRLRDRWSRD